MYIPTYMYVYTYILCTRTTRNPRVFETEGHAVIFIIILGFGVHAGFILWELSVSCNNTSRHILAQI